MADKGADEEGPFLPMRQFYAAGRGNRRAQHEQERERRIAEFASKAVERGRRPPGRRTRGLSQGDIVEAAVTIADAEGTEAVSMRRIAKDLQMGVMSLYWYVESKEELHQLMLETVQAEIEAAKPSGDWRADLSVYARNTRAAVHRHPWAIDYLGAGPPTGSYDARNLDRLIGSFDGLDVDGQTVMWTLMTLGTYVIGAVLREIQEMRWHRASAETTAALSEEEVNQAYAEFHRRVHDSDRYPHLAKIVDTDIDPDAPETRDERFEFGLSCLLDGLAARIRPGKD